MKKIFISFATFVAASALMSGCSNDESTATTTTDQLTAFTGGVVTEVPMERVQIGTSDSSTVVPGFTTRTSMNRNGIGVQGAFLWEPKDVIYVEDDKKKLCKGKSTITHAVASTTFLVDGSYTKGQYDVYYCGSNTGAGAKKVVIAGNQTQAAFNNTKHFGAAGDCGVAKAAKTTVAGKRGYHFNLQHKASYLCFLPYMAIKAQRANFRIKRIEITSNNNISGTYGLTQAGLSGTGNSKTITLNVGRDGLKLADQATATKSIKNSLYVVIAPGTHALKVKYTVSDAKNTVMTITKSYKSHNFGANKICDIPVNFGVRHYSSGCNYYMWDAAKNYWFGHEWNAATPWQPTENRKTNDGYPKSKAADPSRWYHEHCGPFEAPVNPLFKKLPNANEITWYVQKGDAHWDNSTQWEVFGELHTGGIWLKKLSVIAQENGKKLAALKLKDPWGEERRGSYSTVSMSIDKTGKPSDRVIGKYFFLPALGYYLRGTLWDLGSVGYYWSSSAYGSGDNAHVLYFSNDDVELVHVGGNYGIVPQPFE